MQWRNMTWPAYGPPQQEDELEVRKETVDDIKEFRIEVSKVSEPGPVVEVRELLRRLYGEVDECGTPNPYIAKYTRLKGSAVPESENGQENPPVVGVSEYRYWPSLKLGYIENVRVSSSMRRKGLGVKLVDFTVDYVRNKGVQRIYSFAVNRGGFKLLKSAGFTPETPDDPERPWRTWFYKPNL